MNRIARCSACNGTYTVHSFEEKKDTRRVCDSCHIERLQMQLPLVPGRTVNFPGSRPFPAATAAGPFKSTKE